MKTRSSKNLMTDKEIYEKYQELQNKSETARRLNLPYTTVWDAIQRERNALFKDKNEVQVEIPDEFKISEIDTDILNQYGLNPDQWRIDSISKNEWETPFKDSNDVIISKTNKQTKVLFKKVLPDITIDVIKEHYKMLEKNSRSVSRMRTCDVKEYLYEIAVADHHFGKLCWAAETGETYDIKIAKELYIEAVDDLLNKVRGFKIDKILMPVGNDLFNIDGIGTTTTAGTPQDVDSRWTKIFRVVSETMVEVIDMCADCADVDVLIIPGNHDRAACFYLGEFLNAWYRNDENVRIDNSPALRKYYRYGSTLMGFTHGSEEKAADLPLLMAREAKEHWGNCEFHEIHTGHYHRKKATKYIAGDTYNGVHVRILDSLTFTDAWHYSKGYVKGTRAATGILFHKSQGYIGEFCSKYINQGD